MKKTAVISEDGKHRYKLSREWDASLPKVLFIMLNPSTADAENDDPTIRRCIGFAKAWGYGGIWVGNLFSYRTAYPKELKGHDVYTSENLKHIYDMKNQSDKIICAWGNSRGLPAYICNRFDGIYYLELSKNRTPKHPLYLKGSLLPQKLHK